MVGRIREILHITQYRTPSRHAWLPRCPAKSREALRDLAAKGEHWHGATEHLPCDACRCVNVAGKGTRMAQYRNGANRRFWRFTSDDIGHYGLGFCARHEGASDRLRMLGLLRAYEHYFRLVELGKEYEDTVSRNFIANMRGVAMGRDPRRMFSAELKYMLDKFNALRAVLDGHGEFTESSGKGPVEASDDTRLKRAMDLAKLILQADTVYHKIAQDTEGMMSYDFVCDLVVGIYDFVVRNMVLSDRDATELRKFIAERLGGATPDFPEPKDVTRQIAVGPPPEPGAVAPVEVLYAGERPDAQVVEPVSRADAERLREEVGRPARQLGRQAQEGEAPPEVTPCSG